MNNTRDTEATRKPLW